MGPGQIQLTVTPRRPSSTARDRVSPITPCLLAVYGLIPAVAPRPSVEAIVTMRPRPRAAGPPVLARRTRADPGGGAEALRGGDIDDAPAPAPEQVRQAGPDQVD